MKIRMTVIALASIFVLSMSSSVSAQPAVPDYSKWASSEFGIIKCLHNGKETLFGRVVYTDILKDSSGVVILKAEDNKPWLLLYNQKGGNKAPTHYLFEYSNEDWNFVREFSNDQENDLYDLLKTRYGLELQ